MGPFFLRYLIVAAAIAAACYSLILARAAHLFALGTAASVPAAVALVPYHAAYTARLAAWQPLERDRLLHRAVELNPWDYQSWIQLGFAAEMQQGNIQAAERDYLRAAEVNHMFLPRWTLTNFYFRQRRPSDFFRWANAALQITPYSSDPIFSQMWLVSQDSGRISAAVPDRARVLLQYAWFLSNARQFTAIPPIMRRLIARVGHANPRLWGRDDLVASIEDQILGDGDRRDGLAIWTSLKDGGWIHHSIPDSEHPLTNGDFRVPFFRHGFDWEPMDSTGARVEHLRDMHTVRISLSGEQRDHCVLLRQYVPLAPGSVYNLAWRIAAPDTRAGLAWHLRGIPATAGSDLVSGDLLASSPALWQFRAPTAELAMLSLEYSRPLGSVRAVGTVTLQSVSLEKQ